MDRSVLIRCDGSHELGLGHVVRCLALAQELRDGHGRKVTFATRSDPLGIGLVREAGFSVIEPPSDRDFDYVAWLTVAIREAKADTLVVDVRDDLTTSDLRAVQGRTDVRIAAIDDATDRRLAADQAFYPPVPRALALDWPGFNGQVHVGWEWVLLRPEFAAEPVRVPGATGEPPVVLISMGGSDPGGLTLVALRALALVPTPVKCVVLIGPGFRHDVEVAGLLETALYATAVVRDGDVRAQMLAADMAVLSFGVTSYEAAACALPAIHLCLTPDHAISASAMNQAGIAVSLGLAADVHDADVAETIESMLADVAGRAAMGARARGLVDGNGAARIADVLTSEIS
jgi:spore coat polysaccharide biosynthesis protein SpsF